MSRPRWRRLTGRSCHFSTVIRMEPTHEISPETNPIPALGYHAYVGLVRTLGRGDDGFCPATPADLCCALERWTRAEAEAEAADAPPGAQMYMPPFTPIT
jgi:hypothetical protein